MTSSVLRSKRAVQVNIEIMRIFVWLFLNPVNDLNGAKRLNVLNSLNGPQYSLEIELHDWNGLQPPIETLEP